VPAIESISSKKTIVGASSRAFSNVSRSCSSDSPLYFDMISGPEIVTNSASTSLATARAISVFPVPGGPYSRTPEGGSTPRRLNSSGSDSGSSIISRTNSSSSSRPPMSS